MSEKFWVDLAEMEKRLDRFFQHKAKAIGRFGSRVNQIFEAFVFAQVVAWHRENGWTVVMVHPPSDGGTSSKPGQTSARSELRLKFSTRGRPSGYSYAKCSRDGRTVQVRHALRVMTHAGQKYAVPKANVVLDVAVISDRDLSAFSTHDALDNSSLVTFGEAKHMSAFAELVAAFLGLVAELQPIRIKGRSYKKQGKDGLLPFLYVSGFLTGTAIGIAKTIKRRGYAVDIYTQTAQLAKAVSLATRPAPSSAQSASGSK